MKKTLIYIGIFITFIFIYFLHSNLFNWFNIAGVQPNLFVILLLFCGLYTGKKSGLICGVMLGILLDLLIGTSVIISPIMLGIIGFASGILEKNFSKESRFNIMVMVAIATLAYEIGENILRIIIININFELIPIIKVILVEILYNAMLTIIIYPIIQFFGKKVENALLGNKILRYF